MQNYRINYRESNHHQQTACTQSEITELVATATEGDFEAFGRLYHLYVERIYKYVFYQVKDKMTAEDITSDVFTRALEKIESCRGKEATFSAWLYRIAHNRTIDHFRLAKRNLPLDTEMTSKLGDPKQELGRGLEREEIFAAISLLPQNQRQFVILKFIEGLNNREVGLIMGKSQVAVRLLQLRALASLRKHLGSRK